jgi:hypothetical protein
MNRPALIIRESIEHCTGNGGVAVEDDRDYCIGWVPIDVASAGAGQEQNCNVTDEYK